MKKIIDQFSHLHPSTAWNKRHPTESRESARAWRKRNPERKQPRRLWFKAQKDKPCADCGKRYHSCQMDFDHVRGKKLYALGKEIGRERSLQVLIAEIAKCDLVCSNCHRLRTWNRRNKDEQLQRTT